MSYIKLSKSFWEKSFSNGYGDVLADEKERIRYQRITRLISDNKSYSTILDLGCGTGLLENFLPEGYTYVGVDISEHAIQTAIDNKKHLNSEFVCDDICSYVPCNVFDIIVFNESLYYISDPYTIIKKFLNYLNDDGMLMISIYSPDENHPSYEIFSKLYDSIRSWGYGIKFDEQITSGNIKWKLICLKKN